MLGDKQVQKRGWKHFTIFTIIVGLIVGTTSVISDNLFLLGDISFTKFVISYLSIMINSLPMWFILAMFVGYTFSRSLKEAALFAVIYTIVTITFYFVIGYFYDDNAISTPITTYVEWYGASALGGLIGGVIGFFLRKTPFVLLILLAGLLLQLYINGMSSWNNIIGISQNITFCLMILSILIYLVTSKISSCPKTQLPNSMSR